MMIDLKRVSVTKKLKCYRTISQKKNPKTVKNLPKNMAGGCNG